MINSLNRLEIEASIYRVNITPVILALLGVKGEQRTDELYRKYFDLLEHYENYDSTKKGLNGASAAIYKKLLRLIKQSKR